MNKFSIIKYIFLYTFIFTCICQIALSQGSFLDSISNESLKASRFVLLEKRTVNLVKTNPSLVLEWTKTWQEWAKKEQKTNEIAKSKKYKGQALFNLGKFKESAFAYIESAHLVENSSLQNNDLIAECYQLAGVSYMDLELYDLAKEFSLKSIVHAKKMDTPDVLVMNFATLGDIYIKQGDFEKSLIYFDSCLQIDRLLDDTIYISGDLSAIGIINSQLGRKKESVRLLEETLQLLDTRRQTKAYCKALNAFGLVYSNNKDFKKAKKYFLQAYKLSKELKDTNLTINRLINLGDLHSKYGDFELAEKYLLNSLKLLGNNYQSFKHTTIYKGLGKIYYKKKQFKKAVFYNEKALKIAKEKEYLPDIKDIYQSLLELNKEQGNYKLALNYAEKYQAISDSTFSLNASKRADALNFKYKTAKKESAIQTLIYTNDLKEKDLLNLQSQKKWLAITIFLLLLLGSLGFYVFRQRQQQQLKSKEIKIKRQLNEIVSLRKDIAQALEEKQINGLTASLSLTEINHLIKEPLSEREFEVLQQIVKGKNNREIASIIFLSINTVKYHLKNIYSKLDVNNRLQVIHLLLKK